MESLEKRIQYHFRDPGLLEEAMTHPSARHRSRGRRIDYQRLEFLGDSVLNVILSDALFRRLPDCDEGMLSKLRSRLISERALATMARAMGLGAFIRFGKTAPSTCGSDSDPSLADALEALIGAIYLDGTVEDARAFVLRTAGPMLENVAQEPTEVNPKGQLQELLQQVSTSTPTYEILREEGPAHQPRFQARASWNGRELGWGEGPTKQRAEIAAARAALEGGALKTILDDLRRKPPQAASPL